MIVNRITWAKMHGVNRAAVTMAIKRGGLVSNADGNINTDDPVNAAWSKKIKTPKKKKAPPEKKPTKKITIPKQRDEPAPPPFEGLPEIPEDIPDDPPIGNALDESDIGMLQAEKMRAEIRLKREQEQAYRIGRLQKMGVLVEREEVKQTLGKFNAELRIRLLDLPGTITPRILSALKAGQSAHEIEMMLADDIGAAIEAAKAVVLGAGF